MSMLAALMGAHWIVEQPVGSGLCNIPEFDLLLNATGVDKPVVTWLGAFGSGSPKPLWLWGTAAWLPQLRRQKPASIPDHLRIDSASSPYAICLSFTDLLQSRSKLNLSFRVLHFGLHSVLALQPHLLLQANGRGGQVEQSGQCNKGSTISSIGRYAASVMSIAHTHDSTHVATFVGALLAFCQHLATQETFGEAARAQDLGYPEQLGHQWPVSG
jgi:hypothetical protein